MGPPFLIPRRSSRSMAAGYVALFGMNDKRQTVGPRNPGSCNSRCRYGAPTSFKSSTTNENNHAIKKNKTTYKIRMIRAEADVGADVLGFVTPQ